MTEKHVKLLEEQDTKEELKKSSKVKVKGCKLLKFSLE